MAEQRPIRVEVPGRGIVEFPAGTSEDTMRQALASLSSPAKPEPETEAAPFNAPRGVDELRAWADKNLVDRSTLKDRARSLPLAVGALTGGASVPVQMGMAGAAGAAATGIAESGQPMTMRERVESAAKSGAGQALLQGASALVPMGANALRTAGRNLWKGTAKITEPVAKTTQTMRAGGSLNAAKDEIAETVLSQGRGTIRTGNLDAMKASLNDLDDALDAVIVSSKGAVPRQKIVEAIEKRMAEIGEGSSAHADMQAALQKTLDEVYKLPQHMTPSKAQSVKRTIYKAYEKSYAADSAEAAKAMAAKTEARALREGVTEAVPESAQINAAMSKQIPAVKAMDKALSRGSNRDIVGLSQMLAGMVTNPLTTSAALLNHPAIGSFSAQQIYRAAKLLPKKQQTVANIIRAAKLLAADKED